MRTISVFATVLFGISSCVFADLGMNEEHECRKFKAKLIEENWDLINPLEQHLIDTQATTIISIGTTKRIRQDMYDQQLRQYHSLCANR